MAQRVESAYFENLDTILKGKGIVLNRNELDAVAAQLIARRSAGTSGSQQYLIPTPPPALRTQGESANKSFFATKNAPSPLLKRQARENDAENFGGKQLVPNLSIQTEGEAARYLPHPQRHANAPRETFREEHGDFLTNDALEDVDTVFRGVRINLAPGNLEAGLTKRHILDDKRSTYNKSHGDFLTEDFDKRDDGDINEDTIFYGVQHHAPHKTPGRGKDDDFLRWGQPKVQNKAVSPRVEYDYVPPFGTTNAEDKQDFLRGATGDQKLTLTVEIPEPNQSMPTSPGATLTNIGTEKFPDSPRSPRVPWESHRRHVKSPVESTPIYLREEQEYRDGATHERNAWSTSKKHLHVAADGRKIIEIAMPKEESKTHFASSTIRAPWLTKKKTFDNRNALTERIENSDKRIIYGDEPHTLVHTTTHVDHIGRLSFHEVKNKTSGIKRQLGRPAHSSNLVITDQSDPNEGDYFKTTLLQTKNGAQTGGSWWSRPDYCDNIGAAPSQWESTYMHIAKGSSIASPKNAKYGHLANLPVSTVTLSEELYTSPRVANSKNRTEYHKAKNWFNTIRRSHLDA